MVGLVNVHIRYVLTYFFVIIGFLVVVVVVAPVTLSVITCCQRNCAFLTLSRRLQIIILYLASGGDKEKTPFTI